LEREGRRTGRQIPAAAGAGGDWRRATVEQEGRRVARRIPRGGRSRGGARPEHEERRAATGAGSGGGGVQARRSEVGRGYG